jgi:hypothetical protein
MFTEDKVTEIFCMADDFCRFFDAMMEKYTLRDPKKRKYHRDGTLSKAEVMVIIILFQLRGQHAAEGMQEPAHPYPQDLQGYCSKRQMLYGLVLWIQAPSYL